MRIGFGLVAVATVGLAGMPAAADVSAEDVWASAMAPFEALNAEIEASPVREGDRLVVDDIEIRFDFAQGRGRLVLTTNGMVLEEAGDGTVSVRYPAESKCIVRLEFDGEDGAPEAIVLTRELDGTAFEQVASGAPGDVTHAFRTDELLQVMRVEMPEAAGGADVRMTMRITGSEGSYRVTDGDLLRIGGAFDYETIIVDSVSETEMPGGDGVPPVMATQATAQRMEGVAVTYEGALPKGTLSLMNLSEGLRDGLAFSLTSKVAATGAETVMTTTEPGGEAGDAEMFRQTYDLGPQAAAIRLDAGGLSIEGQADRLTMAMAAEVLPVPLVVGFEAMGYRFATPLNRTEGPEEAALALSLQGMTLGEEAWAMVDPGGALPRDPADLSLEATAAVELFAGLLDFPSIAVLEEEGEAPTALRGLTVQELAVAALGARLTGEADLRFDEADGESQGGFPEPEGVIELVLEGGQVLIDRLVEARLLPEDQAAGARMMLGVFAVPGEGEDTMTSTIELKPGGVIEANGQRVR
ncbi:DUF2125 domain-containing protein [Roseovarius sp.]|uniref:DUF2125 domain-containing protein n=1 Tax=Roseovarius sp. TaxID=1486281 RepID=UPI003BA9E45E